MNSFICLLIWVSYSSRLQNKSIPVVDCYPMIKSTCDVGKIIQSVWARELRVCTLSGDQMAEKDFFERVFEEVLSQLGENWNQLKNMLEFQEHIDTSNLVEFHPNDFPEKKSCIFIDNDNTFVYKTMESGGKYNFLVFKEGIRHFLFYYSIQEKHRHLFIPPLGFVFVNSTVYLRTPYAGKSLIEYENGRIMNKKGCYLDKLCFKSLQLLTQMIEMWNAANEVNWCICDVKPDNIVIGQNEIRRIDYDVFFYGEKHFQGEATCIYTDVEYFVNNPPHFEQAKEMNIYATITTIIYTIAPLSDEDWNSVESLKQQLQTREADSNLLEDMNHQLNVINERQIEKFQRKTDCGDAMAQHLKNILTSKNGDREPYWQELQEIVQMKLKRKRKK